MNIGVVLIAFSVLIMAWALERIFTKMQTMERHLKGLRKRVKMIEKRVVKGGSQNDKPSRVKTAVGASSTQSATSFSKPKQKAPAGETVCTFCGTKYSMELDKCPKCNHINIEKYRLKKRTPQHKAEDDDFDI